MAIQYNRFKPMDVAELLGQYFASISSSDHYTSKFQQIRESTTIVPLYTTNSESYNLPFSMEEMESTIHNSSPTSLGEDVILHSLNTEEVRIS